jgi:hypothetical protein
MNPYAYAAAVAIGALIAVSLAWLSANLEHNRERRYLQERLDYYRQECRRLKNGGKP